jgi:mannose-1-phosphate guanylyltransferase
MERSEGQAGERWGVVLAGGDGTRLRALTRQIAGDDRPKQFCAVLGGRTLLEETRRRLHRSIPPRRTLLVLSLAHERFFLPALAGMPGLGLLVQPENRGTAPAILYALRRIARRDPAAAVVVMPSDHYVSDDRAFMAHVETAFVAVAARPDRVVLLGMAPDRSETEYGWIEPGPSLGGRAAPTAEVRRFWEKPSPATAEALLAWGCLWNCFVMVARVDRLARLIGEAAPRLARAFEPLEDALETAGEATAARALYAGLAPVDLSRDVLAARPEALAVLPIRGVEWNDLGEPRRVLATRQRIAAARLPGAVPAGIAP